MTPPPKLDYTTHLYLHITAPSLPTALTASTSLSISAPSPPPAPAPAPTPTSAPSADDSLSQSTILPLQLKYVAPIGELEGEYIYQVSTSTPPSKEDRTDGTAFATIKENPNVQREIMDQVRRLQGVKRVKVLQPVQRAKR